MLANEEREQNTEIAIIVNKITNRMNEDENTEVRIEREPVKKLIDNHKFKDLMRLGNAAIEKILTNQPEEFKCITNLNKVICATATTRYSTLFYNKSKQTRLVSNRPDGKKNETEKERYGKKNGTENTRSGMTKITQNQYKTNPLEYLTQLKS